MIPILYESTETTFEHNGLGRLYDCARCEVTEERNGIYECEFDYPIDGTNIDLIIPGRIIMVEHDDTGDLQPFDIYAYSHPINGVITFKARHVSYRLNYVCINVEISISSLQSMMDLLNGEWSTYYQPEGTGFIFNTNKTGNGYMSSTGTPVPRTIRQVLGGIEGSILDTYGGEYEFDRFIVNLWDSRGQDREFTVRYGVNLTDYSEEMDYGGSYNAVVAYWEKEGDGRVSGRVTNNLPSFDGRVDCVPLDLSNKWENKPSSEILTAAAQSWLSSKQPNLPSQSIKVNFIRLADTEEYAEFASLQTCRLCDRIKVVFPRYGIEGMYKIVKVVWDVLQERYTEMELGNLSISLAEALGIK